ncbi:MAG TPA: peptidyl-prolyl cis-trans isomerase, partial [Polyangiaceae bacterium]|nr:peptidyl-prolyl cis-trans isomerase [Polyangiaceae bacterium]
MGTISGGCKEQGATLPDAAERDARTGLTPHEAQEVLVRVGERDITLGQYAETLLRMDQYERLRYQSEERQKELLDEMIEVELLAQEAKRRGLDRDPEVQLRLRQALRDEVLNDLERKLPGPEQFTEREVKEYYEAHRSEFAEPLRHRVQVIRLGSASVAEAARKELVSGDTSGSAEKWGQMWSKYSLDRDRSGP